MRWVALSVGLCSVLVAVEASAQQASGGDGPRAVRADSGVVQAGAPVGVGGMAANRGVVPTGATDSQAGAGSLSGRSAVATTPATPGPVAAPAAGVAAATARTPIARVSVGSGTLPNEHGQVWREYDITPYTARVTSTNRPEQAIVEWVFDETGYEAWHSEPLAILSATTRTLRVYHTPAMQSVVGEVVDRFVSSEAESQGFNLRLVSMENPGWRERMQRLLLPVQVQTAGVQAWLLEPEAAAGVVAELRRRGDYHEHNVSNQTVQNGQPLPVQLTRQRSYIRNALLRQEAWPGFQLDSATIDEGFRMEFRPLLSLDRKWIDASFKCEIGQVERLVPVMLDVPTAIAPRQRTKIEVPQVSQHRFHERFRWPVERVLLISLGMTPSPVPGENRSIVAGLTQPLSGPGPRSDVLLFVESRGKAAVSPQLTQGTPPASPYTRR